MLNNALSHMISMLYNSIVPLIAGLAVGIALVLLFAVGAFSSPPSSFIEKHDEGFFVKYLTMPRLGFGGGSDDVRMQVVIYDEVKCILVTSYVAAEVLPEYKEMTIKRGSSAIAKLMLIHASTSLLDDNYYAELTLVLGSDKIVSSISSPDYIYYDEPPQREKVVVLKANQTKVIPITIRIPENFPDEEMDKNNILLHIRFDIAEQSVPGQSFVGIGSKGDSVKVKILP